MIKTKTILLLGVIAIVAIGMAYATEAGDGKLGHWKADTHTKYKKWDKVDLTDEQKAEALDIALNDERVAALMGLASGTYEGTVIKGVKFPSGKTFVFLRFTSSVEVDWDISVALDLESKTLSSVSTYDKSKFKRHKR